MIVDPHGETIVVHDENAGTRIVRAGDTLTHAALPGFALDAGALFARVKR